MYTITNLNWYRMPYHSSVILRLFWCQKIGVWFRDNEIVVMTSCINDTKSGCVGDYVYHDYISDYISHYESS